MSGAARGDALYAGVTKQLEILGEDHVGYRGKAFRAASGTAFSVVGARPFSKVQPPILSLSRILSSLESLAFDPAPLLLSAMRVFFSGSYTHLSHVLPALSWDVQSLTRSGC